MWFPASTQNGPGRQDDQVPLCKVCDTWAYGGLDRGVARIYNQPLTRGFRNNEKRQWGKGQRYAQTTSKAHYNTVADSATEISYERAMTVGALNLVAPLKQRRIKVYFYSSCSGVKFTTSALF